MNYSKENNKRRMKQYTSPTAKIRNKVGYITLRGLIALALIGVFAVTAAGAGFYLSVIQSAPDVRDLSRGVGQGSFDTVILDRHGNEVVLLDAGVNRTFAPWEDIPEHLQNAFIAIEDERFFEHNGVDLPSVARALYYTVMHDRSQGASTITQQLIKNQLGLMRNTFETKLQEQYMAIRFEAMLVEELGSVEAAKQQILHDYLNIIYLGHGNQGVQAAARFYFNKDVSELTLSESAVIASITQMPWLHSPVRFPENNRYRQVTVLNSMLRLEMITEEEWLYAYEDNVFDRIEQFRETVEAGDIWNYFVDAVIRTLHDDFVEQGMTSQQAYSLIYHGGLRVYTTMDSGIQSTIDAAFLNETLFPTNPQDFEYFMDMRISVRNTTTGAVRHYQRTSVHFGRRVTNRAMFDEFTTWALNDVMGMDDVLHGNYRLYYRPQPQSSMIIIDHNNGHVMAIAGQRGPKQQNRAFCRATQSVRQPGSVFKIFAAYAPAVDLGLITAATGIDDAPNVIFRNGRHQIWPNNWYRNSAFPFRGWNSTRASIEQSHNVSAVKVWGYTGGQNVFNYLQAFGFTTLNAYEANNAAVALGGVTHGVTNLEITAAMGAIANGGILHQTIFYTHVYDRHGDIIIDNRNLTPTQVISRNSAYVLTDMMRGVMTGHGTAGSARFPGMDMAGKTGTTENGRDQYFVAYTPYFTAGVWIGHDRARDLSGAITSVRPDTRIWRHVMVQVHEDLPNRSFERPPGFT
ncbi:MAG: transglycosylase domain-containing protein, partial [Defluviitaleaceae bacterium]|nr:transglycosylase domain-containing protein [Defluviitaleaceae bacterium]